jgi:hypothetical protein
MKFLPTLLLSLLLPSAGFAQVLYSDFTNPSFSGTTDTDGWFDLNSTNFPTPTYPTTFPEAFNAWGIAAGSNQAGSGDAGLNKTPGTSGYFTSAATNAVYSPNALGTFSIVDATPVSGLANILIQVSGTGNLGASAMTLDFNGGNQDLAPTETLLLQSGPISTTFGPSTKYIWAYQWDVSLLGPITDFTATWSTTAPHELTFGARLDQSSVYAAAIPEPSSMMLFTVGLGAAFLLRRKSRMKNS